LGFFFFFKSYFCLSQTAFSLLSTFTCMFTTVCSFSLLFLYVFFFHVLFAVLTSCFSTSLSFAFAWVRLQFLCYPLLLVSLLKSIFFIFSFLHILCFSYFCCSYFLLVFFLISFFCLCQTAFSLLSTFTCKFLQSLYSFICYSSFFFLLVCFILFLFYFLLFLLRNTNSQTEARFKKEKVNWTPSD
jgi:hypothetical protein